MTPEVAALRIQLSEEINKQRDLQKHYESLEREVQKQKADFEKSKNEQ